MPLTPKPASDEPQLAREEDVAVDRKDTDGEEMMKKVRNEKMRDPTSEPDKEDKQARSP